MKIKTSIFPWFTLATGVLGMVFRFWLNTAGTDSEGLIIPFHPSGILMLVAAALTLAVLGLCVWGMSKEGRPFRRSVFAGIGCFIAAAGILIADFIELASASDGIAVISFICGLLAAGCFVSSGISRLQGKPTHLIAHVGLILYFMAHLIMQYRAWCSIPQLYTYFFPLLGSVSLLLCIFHRACKDLLQTKERGFLFFNQAALFCCLLSLSGSSWPFYATMAVWTVAELLPAKEK